MQFNYYHLAETNTKLNDMGKEELLLSDKCTIPATCASPQGKIGSQQGSPVVQFLKHELGCRNDYSII